MTVDTVPQLQTYEEICDHSREVVGEIDERRWIVGDDALLIDTKYGEHTMDDFARDIGMNKSTVKGWKRVCEFYPKSIRGNLFEGYPNLTYSHMKDALRLKDLDEALVWLEQVSSEGWGPDKASHELTLKLGEKPQAPSIPGEISDVYQRDGMGVVEILIAIDDMSYIKSGSQVNLKPKE